MLPDWAKTRWVVVPGFIGVAVALWNGYVAMNNNGVIEGRVVDPAGRPVAGASVVLLQRGFVTHTETARTSSDANGSFRFADNQNHAVQLEAEAPGLGRSERRIIRLWFRGQDIRLAEPLRFAGPRP